MDRSPVVLFLVVLFVGDGLIWRRTHQTEATRNGKSRSMNSWINGAHDGSWSTTNENGVTLMFWWKTWGYFMLFWCSFSDQRPPPLYLGVPRFGKQSAGERRSPSFGCVPFAPNYQATRGGDKPRPFGADAPWDECEPVAWHLYPLAKFSTGKTC